MLKASHTEHAELVGLQKVSLRPGQFVYGRHKAAEELKIKESTLYKYMMWLKNEEILNIQSNNKFSVVTVVNWDLYQMDEPKSNSKNSSKVTTKEQQRNTNKNDKNDKNDIRYINISPQLKTAIEDFKEYRKKIKKPMTDRAVELLIDKLNKLASDDETKIAILNQSIVNGWQGVFPLKQDASQGRPKSKSSNPFLELAKEEGLL